ncbi:MAG: glycosyltransferase family 4 protein [Syntrophomonadaceae bacterium]|jgi:glycosyltransferase involved in cell wall biosynthesis
MQIINLGTYPPKQCGIATFSMDLRQSLKINGNDIKIIAVSDDSFEYRYSKEVIYNLKQNHKQDYIKAAAFINSLPRIKLVIIQHEYGIYGGKDGEYILDLVRLLRKPYVLVTHTVLPQPSKQQKEILHQLCHRATGIICMTNHSKQILTDLYEAPAELIKVIAHGVPTFKKETADSLKKRFNYTGRQIISTFGLIGPGKGLELGIRAIASIARDYPSILYLILGQTHPMLRKHEGEKYRQMLEHLVKEQSLENNVQFINKFLSDKELGEYLYMTDIYLSPYPNKDQAVSGTMAFAIGCGRAIVSTSYAYAKEVLMNNRGLLAKEADPLELASLIKRILDDESLKLELQKKSYQLGETWAWPNIGKEYTRAFSQLLNYHSILEDSISYGRL